MFGGMKSLRAGMAGYLLRDTASPTWWRLPSRWTRPSPKRMRTFEKSAALEATTAPMLDKASGRPEQTDPAGPKLSGIPPLRPAWVEVDLERLRANFTLIHQDKPPGVAVCSVVKDEAYGHGAIAVARAAVQGGGALLAVSTLDEAMSLRGEAIEAPILVLGERTASELPWCVE